MTQPDDRAFFVRHNSQDEIRHEAFIALGDRYLQQYLSLYDLNQLSVAQTDGLPLIEKLLSEGNALLNEGERQELRAFIDSFIGALGGAIGKSFNLETGEVTLLPEPKVETQTIRITSPEVQAIVSAMIDRGTHRILAPDKGQMIAQALVSAAVSGFEVLVGSVAREAFKINKTALGKSDHEFTLEELLKYDSIQEATDELINRRVESLLLGSVDDWSNWCKRTLQFELPALTDDWPAVREIFARRNIIVHNAGQINSRYLTIAASSGIRLPNEVKVGAAVVTDREYVGEALQELLALGLCLVQAVWRKLYPKTVRESAQWLVHRQETLVSDSLWHAVRAISHCLEGTPKDRHTECLSNVNGWLASLRLTGAESVRDEIQGWDTSGLTEIFSIYKACLTGDVELATQLVEQNLGTKRLTKYDFMTHPIFDEVRAHIAARETPGHGSSDSSVADTK